MGVHEPRSTGFSSCFDDLGVRSRLDARLNFRNSCPFNEYVEHWKRCSLLGTPHQNAATANKYFRSKRHVGFQSMETKACRVESGLLNELE